MEGDWDDYVCAKVCIAAMHQLREVTREQISQRRDIGVFQQENGAGHLRRVTSETADDIEIRDSLPAQAALWRRDSGDHPWANHWAPATRTGGVREPLLQQDKAGAA